MTCISNNQYTLWNTHPCYGYNQNLMPTKGIGTIDGGSHYYHWSCLSEWDQANSERLWTKYDYNSAQHIHYNDRSEWMDKTHIRNLRSGDYNLSDDVRSLITSECIMPQQLQAVINRSAVIRRLPAYSDKMNRNNKRGTPYNFHRGWTRRNGRASSR